MKLAQMVGMTPIHRQVYQIVIEQQAVKMNEAHVTTATE
jgi:hypothetical protein